MHTAHIWQTTPTNVIIWQNLQMFCNSREVFLMLSGLTDRHLARISSFTCHSVNTGLSSGLKSLQNTSEIPSWTQCLVRHAPPAKCEALVPLTSPFLFTNLNAKCILALNVSRSFQTHTHEHTRTCSEQRWYLQMGAYVCASPQSQWNFSCSPTTIGKEILSPFQSLFWNIGHACACSANPGSTAINVAYKS